MASLQLDLFGAAAPPALAAAPSDPAHEALAARLPATLRLGTSSWSFPGWAGLLYDRAASEAALSKAGLPAYARNPLLRAVGLDRTYYAPLDAAAFALHAAQVPEGFRFLVKASQECTSPTLLTAAGGSAVNPRFLDAAWAREAVVAPAVEGLGAKLGVLLFQFPPLTFSASRRPEAVLERLRAFLAALPTGVPYGVELRSPALFTPAYARLLEETGALHAYVVHPAAPDLEAQARLLPPEAQPALVLRWMLGHGRGYEEARELYRPFDRLAAPDPDTREAVARICARAVGKGRPGIVIVNNKAEGCSPRSVFALAERIVGEQA
ncbi:MAG: DUF72 domain-containing protein [Anaeromyxobacteraceae bacterium]